MEKFSFKDVLVTFAGLLITAFIAWVLISATGNNPSEVALYLYEGGFKGTRNIANSLYQATPLILTAVATLISFRVGMLILYTCVIYIMASIKIIFYIIILKL